MSAKFKSNEGWRKSSTREVKSKYLGLLLLLGGSCTSSAALLETDAELKKKLEILEARIVELEERLERAGGQKEDASRNFTLEKKTLG